MLKLLLALVLWTGFSGYAAEDKVYTVEEWEAMFESEVRRTRESRSIPVEDDAAYIYDLRDHYTAAFQSINDVATAEEAFNPVHGEKTREEKVKGRFIVFMTDDSDDGHLNRLVRSLTKANRESNGHYIAKHIKKIRHIGKGFSATLSANVVHMVRYNPLTGSITFSLCNYYSHHCFYICSIIVRNCLWHLFLSVHVNSILNIINT